MIRVAQERVADLFALAQEESSRPGSPLAERYVGLARRIGMRYNVRVPPELRELYCRACGAYWIEGRTVRTRLRSGRRTRTCLRCGHIRRVPFRDPPAASPGTDGASGQAPRSDAALVGVEDQLELEELEGEDE